jgi:5-(carboxyamino)imidazole ribonucleotide mutase
MKVAVIMGSKSDYDVVYKAENVLADFGVEYESRVISAHRTPGIAAEFAANAEKDGFEVIICAAGKAAHLAGVMAGGCALPVIGIPMKTSDLGGMDSLLSTVQMPKGVPVATVTIGGAENAALLAVQILSVKYPELRQAFKEYKAQMEQDIIQADKEIND